MMRHSEDNLVVATEYQPSFPSPDTFVASRLGPANPGLTIIAQETLDFRRAGFSPAYQLLIPTFSLPTDSTAPRGYRFAVVGMLLYRQRFALETITYNYNYNCC